MKRLRAAALILTLLAACVPITAEPPGRSTQAPPGLRPSSPADTPTVISYPAPTSFPAATGYPARITSPAPTLRPSPTPGKQVYIDPDGRYQVELPADWLPGDQPGAFAGPDGYFQAGDLPEMGFYSRAYQVCMRLAQTMAEPAASLMSPISVEIDSCEVMPIPYQNPRWARVVVKAPGVSPEKRYFFFESDGAHSAAITASFKMLLPTSPDDILAYPSGALRPADEAFWNTVREPTPGTSITETRLAVAAGDSPARNYQFAGYVPRDVWLKRWGSKPTATGDPLVEANRLLARFGYELRRTSTQEAGPYELYQSGSLIRENISWRTPILSASGNDFALPFFSANGQEVLRRGGPELWTNELSPTEAGFRFLGEDLLAAFWNSQYSSIDVLKDKQLLYRFGTFFGADTGLETFQVWQGHWLMEVRGFLIEDGEIVNDQMGFDEIFDWQLIDGKPFYFFRKGPRVGISYDGQVQPVYYDDVAHYLCCGNAGDNPYYNGTIITFFAQRDGDWYYVQMGR